MKRMYTSQMGGRERQGSCLYLEPLDFVPYSIMHGFHFSDFEAPAPVLPLRRSINVITTLKYQKRNNHNKQCISYSP